MFYNVGFVLRAFVYAFAVVYGDPWPFPAQIMLILGSSTVLACIAASSGSKIWQDPLIRYQYTFNEFAVAWTLMAHLWFSEHVDDYDLRIEIGNRVINFIVAVTAINIFFALLQVFSGFCDVL